MATLKTLYRQFEESPKFNKTYTDAILRARVAETSVSDGTLNSLKLTTTELYVNEEGKVSSFYVGVEAKMSDTTLERCIAQLLRRPFPRVRGEAIHYPLLGFG